MKLKKKVRKAIVDAKRKSNGGECGVEIAVGGLVVGILYPGGAVWGPIERSDRQLCFGILSDRPYSAHNFDKMLRRWGLYEARRWRQTPGFAKLP